MVNLEIRKKLPSDAVVFDNASFDNSIVGITFDGRAIYDFNLMIEEYMKENNCSELEAVEWIEYNTIRVLPYAGEKSPKVMSSI